MRLKQGLKDALRPVVLRALWAWRNRRDGCRVEAWNVSPHARIGHRAIVRAGSEVYADVVLGDYSYVSGPRSYVQSAEIGKFCSIARQVVIGVNNHDMTAVTTHPFPHSSDYGGLRVGARAQPQKPRPRIGNDVWIGMNVLVMRGAVIGDGAVIAANSVVSGEIPPYTVAGGSPARVLKPRFEPAVAEALARIRWWDWPAERLAGHVDLFDDPEEFVRRFG